MSDRAGPGPRVAVLLELATEGSDGRVAALAPILGRSAFQRHLRQLMVRGVQRVVAVLEGGSAGALEAECRRQAQEVGAGELDLCFVATREEAWPLARETGGRVAVVSAPTVLDPRIYEAVLSGGDDVWVGDHDGGRGAAAVPVGLRVTSGDAAPSQDPFAGPQEAVLLIQDIDPYIPNLRRTLRPYWSSSLSEEGRSRAAFAIMDATQKGVLDFPARFLHPPFENAMTRWISGTPITPNQITVVTGFIGIGAAFLFARQAYAPAILIALLVNVLDGVDGKLARVKLLASKFGDRLDHILDVLFEFSWYIGIGWGLSGGDPSGTPLKLAFGLIGIMLGSRAMSGAYKLVSGRQIHDHRGFDRAARLVAGRRNVYVMILVVGLLLGRFGDAFTLCFAWGVATLATYTLRTAVEAVVFRSSGAQTEAA